MTKTEQEWSSNKGTCLPSPWGWGGGLGGTPYNGLYGKASTFFMLHVFGRVGLLLVLCLAERFFSGCSSFPLSTKTNASKFQFDSERTDKFIRVLNNF